MTCLVQFYILSMSASQFVMKLFFAMHKELYNRNFITCHERLCILQVCIFQQHQDKAFKEHAF